MAGADRMTIEEVVRKVLLDEHADVIREAVKAVAAEMMEIEVAELIGARRGERRPEDRATRSFSSSHVSPKKWRYCSPLIRSATRPAGSSTSP